MIDTQIAILRGSRTHNLGGLPAVTYLQLPYGIIKPGGSPENFSSGTGISDISLAITIWPYTNQTTRAYLRIASFLISPTGSYSS